MDDFSIFEPFLNCGFAVAVSIYLLYERAKTNEKILTALQEISICIQYMKNDINQMKKGG